MSDGPEAEPYDWQRAKELPANFADQAVRSYIFLSVGMGFIALALPILLVLVGGYEGHYSISYFYHVSPLCRDILVGSLCATGAFLFLFRGLSTLENWLLNIAGVAAISIAINPMSAQQCAGDPLPASLALNAHAPAWVHGVSALIFFTSIGLVAIFLSKRRLGSLMWKPKRQRFQAAYTAAGMAMILMPAAVIATHFLSAAPDCRNPWIFWLECFGIWSFSAYWFVKTTEYRTLLRIH
ncbi:hypothetical protein [Sphingomonas aerolata]|uniref:hypothetical protein n=1 Tax=Sphingomonas aerolata TaxID=185951 RepID=UPI00208E8980|nr:hypothetical protein [Sphingomonas aerolata]USR02349.1 hypothetical protein NEF64_19160 [Sphingomonas aerolata]